jgi:hypothetical protein
LGEKHRGAGMAKVIEAIFYEFCAQPSQK